MGEQWSKCFEKPAKGIASRNRRAMPAYQCPLARRNQKVGSPGRICRRLCAGSIATCGPLSSLPSQQWMTPDPRQTPKKIVLYCRKSCTCGSCLDSVSPFESSRILPFIRAGFVPIHGSLSCQCSAGITRPVVSVLSSSLPPLSIILRRLSWLQDIACVLLLNTLFSLLHVSPKWSV